MKEIGMVTSETLTRLQKLHALYWSAMEAVHLVAVASAEARLSVARAQMTATECGERFNVALAEYLIACRAPNGHGVDLFSTGTIKPLGECQMDPQPQYFEG